ncbi:MAG: heavy metal translocating P-type ATPase, partial [Clostridia bacterium]|nr:heavy metal translocating P-type ATPase [Clostridia bacterium]
PFLIYLYIAAAIIVGFDVFIDAVNGVVHGHILDENFLMAIGSVSAFIIGEYPEGTAILLLYQVGELFQSIAVGKSRESISELMNIYPDEARLENGEIVDPFDVMIDDVSLVNPGEKIPLDGVLIEGTSSLDTSSLTGEYLPKDVTVGCNVISGCINLTSPIKIRVRKEFSESTVSKIIELVENASSKKAKIENFVTRFARYYTPIVVISAVLVATLPPLLFSAEFKVWLLRAVMFIVVSCPCALVVSVPLSFFGALGAASKSGVLIKGSNYLEALSRLDTVIFDKTGTLTEGNFSVSKIDTFAKVSEEDVLKIAALCEYHSSHPIANSIRNALIKETVKPDADMIFKDISGKGVVVTKKDVTYLAGNAELFKDYGFNPVILDNDLTTVHVAADNKYLGLILLDDKLKDTTKQAVLELRKNKIKNIIVLSGDKEKTVSKIADTLGADKYYYELLPANKVEITERLLNDQKKNGGTVAFVGDGVNDAPVLARADVGIAMGALGSDAAIEAADIVIMNDDLSLISKAIKISKKAMRISKQNIVFSLVIKFTQLLLSLIGLGTVWMAVFADVGVLIIAILNSMRTLYTKDVK